MKIGLLGLGTVGQALLEALEENREQIEARAEGSLEVVKALVLHPEKHAAHRHLITTDPGDVLDDPDIRIVVEVMGGMEPARTHILTALRKEKAVVTANKEVLANAGQELFHASEETATDLLFEASVGAGVPVIRAVKVGLAGNRVRALLGILNGTTNYILSCMENGAAYAEALAEAQAAGYAEADPTADVEGYDAARKAAILASIAFGSRVVESDVHCEGITGITRQDVEAGKRFGWRLKPLGRAVEIDGGLQVRVHPAFVPTGHPLAAVDGIYNAVMVRAEPLGEAMFYGPGAGGPSTASAVLGDVIEAARNLRLGGRAVGCTCRTTRDVLPASEGEAAFFLRLGLADRPGVLSAVTGLLGDHGVSIRSVVQDRARENLADVVVVTHPSREGDFQAAFHQLARTEGVASVGVPIRIVDDAV